MSIVFAVGTVVLRAVGFWALCGPVEASALAALVVQLFAVCGQVVGWDNLAFQASQGFCLFLAHVNPGAMYDKALADGIIRCHGVGEVYHHVVLCMQCVVFEGCGGHFGDH